MHHSISHNLAQARLADLRHHPPARRPARRPEVLRRIRAVPGTVQAAEPAAGDAPIR